MTGVPATVLEPRLIETGYRPYEGARGGRPAAVRSLAVHSMRRALGLRRPARAKVLPVLVIVIAFLPAIVMLGVVAAVPIDVSRVIPGYANYYGYIDAAVILFTALVVPEVICPDRRSGMLRVYMAAPLDGTSYVLAKVLCVGAVLSAITLGPPLLLVTGLTLEGDGPGGVLDVAAVVLHMVAAALVLAAVYGSVALAASAMTDRRAVASTAVILLLLVPGITVATLVENLQSTPWLHLCDIAAVPIQLVRLIHGSSIDWDLPAAALWGAAAAWTALAGTVLVLRHRSAGRRR